MVSSIPLQASCLCCYFYELTNLVLAEWCFQVPDAVVCSSSIIDGQVHVKGAVSIVHFNWTVTSEFLVIMNWTTLIVCCLSGRIKCSCVTITTAHLGSSLRPPNQKFVAHFAIFLKGNVPQLSFLLSSWAWNPK